MDLTLCNTRCCGVLEINNLSAHPTPKGAMEQIWYGIHHIHGWTTNGEVQLEHRCPFIIFTGTTKLKERAHASMVHPVLNPTNYGQAFADYIKKQELGDVFETDERMNHTGNMLKVWIWGVKWEALAAWARLNVPPPPVTVYPTPPIGGNGVISFGPTNNQVMAMSVPWRNSYASETQDRERGERDGGPTDTVSTGQGVDDRPNHS